MEFEEKLLGTILCANGSNISQRARIIGSLRGAFARNSKIFGCKALTSLQKCSFWKSVADGFINYVVPVLRPNKQNLRTVATEYNKLLNRFVRLPREPAETQPSYFKRRSEYVSTLKHNSKCCAIDTWLRRLVTWCTHIFRHQRLPLMRLLNVQDGSWLEDRRDRNHSRPACRAQAGFVSRWAEGWWDAVACADGLGWEVEKNDKFEELRRIQFLREFILGARDVLALGDEELLLCIEDGAAD